MTPTKALILLVGVLGEKQTKQYRYILACLEALSIVIMACDIDAPTYIGPQFVAIE